MDYEPRFESAVPSSQHGFRALSVASAWAGTGGRVVEIRRAVGLLHHPGSYVVACSGQMWEQTSKVTTGAFAVAKGTAVT